LTLASIIEAAEGTLAKAGGNNNPQKNHEHSVNAAKYRVTRAAFSVEHGEAMTYNVDVKKNLREDYLGFVD
jgi:hypothetical protein